MLAFKTPQYVGKLGVNLHSEQSNFSRMWHYGTSYTDRRLLMDSGFPAKPFSRVPIEKGLLFAKRGVLILMFGTTKTLDRKIQIFSLCEDESVANVLGRNLGGIHVPFVKDSASHLP